MLDSPCLPGMQTPAIPIGERRRKSNEFIGNASVLPNNRVVFNIKAMIIAGVISTGGQQAS